MFINNIKYYSDNETYEMKDTEGRESPNSFDREIQNNQDEVDELVNKYNKFKIEKEHKNREIKRSTSQPKMRASDL